MPLLVRKEAIPNAKSGFLQKKYYSGYMYMLAQNGPAMAVCAAALDSSYHVITSFLFVAIQLIKQHPDQVQNPPLHSIA